MVSYCDHKGLWAAVEDEGLEYSHHESDLYLKATPEARRAAVRHGFRGCAEVFTDNEGQQWIEIHFAYLPFWRGDE